MQLIFHGPFDKIAGKKVEIELAAPAELGHILRMLKALYPKLSNYLVDESDELLSAHIMFLRCGGFLRLADTVYEEDRRYGPNDDDESFHIVSEVRTMGNYLDIFSLSGKVSIVTGGGRGIGSGIAKALGGAGSDLMLVARSEPQLRETEQFISREYGRRVETLAVDVSKTENLSAIVQETLARFGRIDILANNAGSNIRKPFLEVTDEDYEAVIRIQLKSAYFLAQAAAKEMVKRGGGKIINLASLTSKIGVPNISVYGAAKGGIFALTKSMALELAPYGINVNAVAPGYVRTTMTEAAFQDQERYDWMLSRIPMKRFGTVDDIGNAALFLASPASDYITGEVIYVDGGWMSA
ncbi:MAG: glucose 1-dehydrogenase [Syntrophobacteraceae bacterium]